MKGSLLILIFLSPFAIGFAAYTAAAWQLSIIKRQVASNSLRKVFLVIPLLVSVPVGLWFSLLTYRFSENAKIVGFPIPAAAWERWGNSWVDFAGPATAPASIANFLFGVLIVYLLAGVLWKVAEKQKAVKQAHTS